MSTAAVTLQCPSCGGVFLTLHQGGDGMEICPHCAVAAPRENYRKMEGQSAFVRARTPLPPKRAAHETVAGASFAGGLADPVPLAARAPDRSAPTPAPPPRPSPVVQQSVTTQPPPQIAAHQSVVNQPPMYQPPTPQPMAPPQAMASPLPVSPIAAPPPIVTPRAVPPGVVTPRAASEPATPQPIAPATTRSASVPAPSPTAAPQAAVPQTAVQTVPPAWPPTLAPGAPESGMPRRPSTEPSWAAAFPPPTNAFPAPPAAVAPPLAATPPATPASIAPLPPPQIGFISVPEAVVSPMPFRTAPSAPSAPPMAPPSPAPIPFQVAEPSPSRNEGPPLVWPGINPGVSAVPAPQPTPVSATPAAPTALSPAPVETPVASLPAAEEAVAAAPGAIGGLPGWMESQQISLGEEEPAEERPRKLPWFSLLVVTSALAGLVLAMVNAARPLRFPAVKNVAPVVSGSDASASQTDTTKAPVATHTPPTPAEEVKPTVAAVAPPPMAPKPAMAPGPPAPTVPIPAVANVPAAPAAPKTPAPAEPKIAETPPKPAPPSLPESPPVAPPTMATVPPAPTVPKLPAPAEPKLAETPPTPTPPSLPAPPVVAATISPADVSAESISPAPAMTSARPYAPPIPSGPREKSLEPPMVANAAAPAVATPPPVPPLPTPLPPPAAATPPVVPPVPVVATSPTAKRALMSAPEPATATTPPPAPELPSAGPLPDAETAAKIRTIQEVLQAIDAAPSLDERLKRIADGEKQRQSVAKFFEAHAGGIKVGGVDSNVGFFNELPSGEDVKLFLAITASCPSGAMVRLRGTGNQAKLDWPLFEQTHQLEFDRFVLDGEAAPRWFSVICARSRTNELAGPSKDAYLALRAQGSLSLRGEGLLYVKKESPAGKFLDSHMVWGRGYLIKALIQHGKLDGKAVMTLEDCEGAAAGK